MTWKTDHDDLTTRTWVCTNCNCTCLSKSPFQRNVHGPGSGDVLQRMYLNALENMSCVKKRPAYPARPREEEYVSWSNSGITERDAPFTYIHRENDICIYLDPGNRDVGDTGKPLDTPADRLRSFFKMIREVTPETLAAYICSQTGGHKWTDDPAEIAARAGKAPELAEEDA